MRVLSSPQLLQELPVFSADRNFSALLDLVADTSSLLTSRQEESTIGDKNKTVTVQNNRRKITVCVKTSDPCYDKGSIAIAGLQLLRRGNSHHYTYPICRRTA